MSGKSQRAAGGSAFTSVTALRRSSMTLLPLFLPISLISFSLTSVALSASSSAFLLPLECYRRESIVSAYIDGPCETST